MYKENFPAKLKKARIDAGYTQREVAEIVKIPQPKIAKLETGAQEPDLETLGALADFYAVSTDWLLGIGPKEKSNAEFNVDLENRRKRAIASELAKGEPFPLNLLYDMQDALISKGILEDTRTSETIEKYIQSKRKPPQNGEAKDK